MAEAPHIRRLDESVVNRIAAGEVIQRPASALKELLENSLDAGATSVSVLVKDGGLKLLQVCDNGHGIRLEDLPILCERHTTSKISSFEDLSRISTLGFRGEALASMTFVAHLSVTTMTEGQTHGYRASYKDGVMEGEARPCAALKGTTVMVENLFYNVTARRKAFRNYNEEYARILDVISRYAVHKVHVSFSCKKFAETRSDVHTAGGPSRTDAIRAVYGPSVARELIELSVSEDKPSLSFSMNGYVSSANYSAKKTTMILFINDRVVDCAPLRRAIEVVYATILPKASKPFIYMSIQLPPQNVDVNVHPTKREVSFLHQEELIEVIQKAVETELIKSNDTRKFYSQTLLPVELIAPQGTPLKQNNQKTPVNKLVRTDSQNPAGRMHAFLSIQSTDSEPNTELAAMRAAVKRRRNPRESSGLVIVEAMVADIDKRTHSGLLEIVKGCTFVGMVNETQALLQNRTNLYLANCVIMSKELLYQQVLRRFAQFNTLRLTNPASLYDLLIMALDEEEQCGRWDESDGPKDGIAKLNVDLLKSKAHILREYFSIEIDQNGNLCTLPLVLDQYVPDMDRLPYFVLDIGNNVDWVDEQVCYETFALALADFYATHPPAMPRPSEDPEVYRFATADNENAMDEQLMSEVEARWAQRDWTIQHVLFPTMKLHLKPPSELTSTFIQVTSLEHLFKTFERC